MDGGGAGCVSLGGEPGAVGDNSKPERTGAPPAEPEPTSPEAPKESTAGRVPETHETTQSKQEANEQTSGSTQASISNVAGSQQVTHSTRTSPEDSTKQFKLTMSQVQIFEKIQEFTGPCNLPQVTTIFGTQSSNKRGGALSDVQLTRRERREKRRQEDGKGEVEKPDGWDNSRTIDPSTQQPPKKRGRKPKNQAEEEAEGEEA